MHSNITNKEPPIDAGLIQSNVYRIAAAFPFFFLRGGREKRKRRLSGDIPHETTVVLGEKKEKKNLLKLHSKMHLTQRG